MQGTVLEARPDGSCLAEFAFTPQTEESNGDFAQGIFSRGQYEIIESDLGRYIGVAIGRTRAHLAADRPLT